MKKIILLIALLLLGCENEVDNFPQVDVNLNLYINNPEFFNIETPGYLKMVITNNSARYSFISAEKNEILWSRIKIGSGLR